MTEQNKPKKSRAQYAREWRKKNPDKYKAAIARYWEKKIKAQAGGDNK